MIDAARGLCDPARLANWDDFRHFLAIARGKTLAAAARELKVEHTTVRRRLSALEQALGTRLFTRGPEGFALTRAGSDILPLVEQMAAQVDGILRRVSGEDDRIEGTVRLTVSEVLGRYLVKELGRLREGHPGLVVEFLTGNRAFDLMRGEADIAVRVRATSEPDLVVKKICVAAWALYATTDYEKRKGIERIPDDLSGMEVIGYDESLAAVPGAQWLSEHARDALLVFRANSIIAALNATLAGMGIGALPCILAHGDPRLRRIAGAGARDIFLVVHPDLVRVARVRAVMDYITEIFRRDAEVWAGTAAEDDSQR